MDLYLSSRSFKYVIESGLEEDMELIILNERIKCSKFVASFLSPKISRAILSDSSIKTYRIKFPERTDFYSNEEELNALLERTNFLTQIRSLFNGDGFHFEPSSEEIFKEVYETDAYHLLSEFCSIIENSELIEKVLDYSEDTEITASNVSEIVKINRLHFNSDIYQRLVEFLSSNFYLYVLSKTVDKSSEEEKESENEKAISAFSKLQLTQEELSDVISSNSLQIENEDSLFEFIKNLGPDFYSLLDCIEVQYLSCERVKEMIDIISEPEFQIHSKLWSSIFRRLILYPNQKHQLQNPREIQKAKPKPKPKIEPKKKASKKPKTTPKVTEASEGIMKQLTDENQANPCECGIIKVETSGIDSGRIQNLFDKSKETHLKINKGNGNEPNGFILIDFKKIRINFSKYYFSVPSSNNGYSGSRPKSWKIEGSNDKVTWIPIDDKENDQSLNDFGRSNTFSCSNATNEYYRYIRICEKISQSNTHALLLSEVEFYGSIESNE